MEPLFHPENRAQLAILVDCATTMAIMAFAYAVPEDHGKAIFQELEGRLYRQGVKAEDITPMIASLQHSVNLIQEANNACKNQGSP